MIRNTGAAFGGAFGGRPIESVFLIFFIINVYGYSLYIPYIFPEYIPYILPCVLHNSWSQE